MGRTPGEEQVGEGGQGVLVGAGVDALTLGLLGRDEGRRPRDHGQPRGHVDRLAETEVADHGADLDGLAPVIGRALHRAEQHVGRLDVTVHDSLLVQGGQAEPDLTDDLERLVARQAPGLEPVGERALVGVPHHEVRPAVVELAGVVDGDDVGRVDLAQEPPLVDEPLLHVVVVGPVVGEHLDGNRGVEALVVSEPHRGEPARADPTPHGVATDPGG